MKGQTRRELVSGLLLAAPFAAAGAAYAWRGSTVRDTLFRSGEAMSYRAHRLLAPDALAPEYTRADLSPKFRTNGSTSPNTADYMAHAETGFRNWQLEVGGLVGTPLALSLDDLVAMPARTQITRHDCVEGWSAIGEWTGVPVGAVLQRAGLLPQARFVVFHCADVIRGWPYYESIDLVDAFHPQTILAYGMNGSLLPTGHGAPIRLRVERQLGYKHAKFVMKVEAVATLAGIGEGKGGFWEDAGNYEWYAGI